jgi:hypothetical protein
VGDQSIAVMDNASASDTSVDDASVAVYRADFAELKAMASDDAGRRIWLAAHRPIWAAISGPLGIPIGGNATLIAASGDLTAFKSLSLMLSGHIHTFEAINYCNCCRPRRRRSRRTSTDVSTCAARSFRSFRRQRERRHLGRRLRFDAERDAGSKSWSIQLYDSVGTPERQCSFAEGASRVRG